MPEKPLEINDINQRIGSLIIRVLNANNITLEEFSLMLGRKSTQVKAWITGKESFTLKHLVEIQLALKIKITIKIEENEKKVHST